MIIITELCCMKRELKKLIEKNTPYKVLSIFDPEKDERCEPCVMTIEILYVKNKDDNNKKGNRKRNSLQD